MWFTTHFSSAPEISSWAKKSLFCKTRSQSDDQQLKLYVFVIKFKYISNLHAPVTGRCPTKIWYLSLSNIYLIVFLSAIFWGIKFSGSYSHPLIRLIYNAISLPYNRKKFNIKTSFKHILYEISIMNVSLGNSTRTFSHWAKVL